MTPTKLGLIFIFWWCCAAFDSCYVSENVIESLCLVIHRREVTFTLQHIATAGKLKALDDEWIQVTFEAPQLQIGGLEFSYGGQSEVKLQIIYIDEKIRLGKGSRGSLFVFQRR